MGGDQFNRWGKVRREKIAEFPSIWVYEQGAGDSRSQNDADLHLGNSAREELGSHAHLGDERGGEFTGRGSCKGAPRWKLNDRCSGVKESHGQKINGRKQL